LDFVTRKITHTIAKIKIALENNKPLPILKLGNLEAQRDWSDAEDFMEGVWLMLNQDKPENYVLGSGEMFTVRHFLNTCLSHADIKFYLKEKVTQKNIIPNLDSYFLKLTRSFIDQQKSTNFAETHLKQNLS
jgi:GDPmannose 4,6-dehydratase